MFYRPAYIYIYRVYNTKKPNISTTKMIVLFEPLRPLYIDINAIIFNNFISYLSGPHNHF